MVCVVSLKIAARGKGFGFQSKGCPYVLREISPRQQDTLELFQRSSHIQALLKCLMLASYDKQNQRWSFLASSFEEINSRSRP
jgi:hypothetical protein